jgi:hydroxysqualene dehydroxylase
MKIAIIGAGWAGMAAAAQLTKHGHSVTIFEASKTLGGRARALEATLPSGQKVTLDNGQHILIGAYSETLKLMNEVGVDIDKALLRLPLVLQFPDGTGLQLPPWPAPFNAMAGIATARGWTWADKASLVRTAIGWRMKSFNCNERDSVATLCQGLSPRVMHELIEPLCVSALNTPADRASGRVFLRVLRDSLFGQAGSSDLLLPKVDLTALFPHAAWKWVAQRGGQLKLGVRIDCLEPTTSGWQLAGLQLNAQEFDHVIVSTSASSALSLLEQIPQAEPWIAPTQALQFEAITTVYAWGERASLAQPMLALRSGSGNDAPAQFVFDRGRLGGSAGLLAFVVSASTGEREFLQNQVLAQAQSQLGLTLQAVQSVVEKRATFACTPGLQRPSMQVAPGLLACGDYVDGPYPATLEGAVRSGLAAAASL